jgi:hypothetical protein
MSKGAFIQIKLALLLLSWSPTITRPAATLTPGLSLYESFSQPPELARMVFYMPQRYPEITLMIGLVLLSIERKMHRQFAAIAPGPFNSQGSIVGPGGLERMVLYILKRPAESA